MLAKESTQKELEALKRHAAFGCLSDPEGISLYYKVGTHKKPIYRIVRGTSALEGYHLHARKLVTLPGFTKVNPHHKRHFGG